MKKIFTALTTVLLMACGGQQKDTYTVKGSIDDLPDNARVHLVHFVEGEEVRESTYPSGGNFQFTGTFEEPFMAYLVIDPNDDQATPLNMMADRTQFYVDRGTVEVTGPSLADAEIKGGQANIDRAEWREIIAANDEKKSALMEQMRQMSPDNVPEGFMERINEEYDALSQEEKRLAGEFIESHPDSYYALERLFMTRVGYSPEDPVEAEAVYNSFSERVRNTKVGKTYGQRVAGWKATTVGSMAPEFGQQDKDGNVINLSDFRGRYVLLDFWASWCGPCRHENPNVVKAFNNYKDKGFTVFGVSLDGGDDAREKWLQAIEDDGLDWPNVSDLKGWQNEVAQLYAVNSIPASYLIDPDGKIIAKNLRGQALEDKLGELLD